MSVERSRLSCLLIWALAALHVIVLLAKPAFHSLPAAYKYIGAQLVLQCALSVQPVLVGFWFAMSRRPVTVRLFGTISAAVAIPLLYFGPDWEYINSRLLNWAICLCVQIVLTTAIAAGAFTLMARRKTLSDQSLMNEAELHSGFSLIQVGWSVAVISVLWAMTRTALYTKLTHLVIPLDVLTESVISVCIGAALSVSVLRPRNFAKSVAVATIAVFVLLLPINIYRSTWMLHWLRVHYEVIDFACGVVAFLCSFFLIRSAGFRLVRDAPLLRI